MRPKGSPTQLEARRRRAVALLQSGLGVREVARRVGSSASSVTRWQAVVKRGGVRALRAKPQPGRPARLSPRQQKRLLGMLLEGAEAHGYGRWRRGCWPHIKKRAARRSEPRLLG